MKKVLRGTWEQILDPETPEKVLKVTWEQKHEEPEPEWTEVWTGSMSLVGGGMFNINGVEAARPTRYTFSSGLKAEATNYSGQENLGTQVLIPVGENVSGPNTVLTGSASFNGDGNWTGIDIRIQILDTNCLTVATEQWAGSRWCWAGDCITLHGTLTLTKIEQA